MPLPDWVHAYTPGCTYCHTCPVELKLIRATCNECERPMNPYYYELYCVGRRYMFGEISKEEFIRLRKEVKAE